VRPRFSFDHSQRIRTVDAETRSVKVIGSFLSPYVRKVLVVLDLKNIAYEIDPIVPFFGDARFAELSPLRRVPVWVDDAVTLCDSSVICQYLEDRYPRPAVYPADIADRARARWLEEFADTRMGDVFIWRLFNQVAIKPAVWGEKADKDVVAKTLDVDVPQVLDYLEGELPIDGFAFGAMSIADISLACFFRNAELARFAIDAARWPKTAAVVARTLASAPFQKLRPIEDRMIRTPIAEHRRVLAELGVVLAPDTVGSPTPRRGVMPL
jgi:glutathione S-transferase